MGSSIGTRTTGVGDDAQLDCRPVAAMGSAVLPRPIAVAPKACRPESQLVRFPAPARAGDMRTARLAQSRAVLARQDSLSRPETLVAGRSGLTSAASAASSRSLS